jgi:aldehyde dehydrogenase (NAD+)
MVSFTGSTRAGTAVAAGGGAHGEARGAGTGRQVGQYHPADGRSGGGGDGRGRGLLWQYGAVLRCADADVRAAGRMDEALAVAKAAAEAVVVGDPRDPAVTMGPLVSQAAIRQGAGLIQKGIDEGATLVTGGVGGPRG